MNVFTKKKTIVLLLILSLILVLIGCRNSEVNSEMEDSERSSILNNEDTPEENPRINDESANINIQSLNTSQEQIHEEVNLRDDKNIINEKEVLNPEEQFWRNRVEKALAPTVCRDTPKPIYPTAYYQGPLIDTHLHIPSIPDWSAEEEQQMKDETPEGRFGGPQALLGWNVKMSEIACTLKQEGTHKNFAFFPAYEDEISTYQLEMWNRTMHEYPDQFTPFIMASGNDGEPDGFPTVDAATLRKMLAAYPNLFEGYGEIGLYERENGGSKALPPDSERLEKIYPLVRQNHLVVYFHLGNGQKAAFERILNANPDITFIWHGDQLTISEIEEVLGKHKNVYYGIDEFFGGQREIFEKYVGESKEEYLETVNENFDKVVKQAVSNWKPLIEQYPDQVLWGTDRGDAVWNYDLDVGQMQVKIARAFTGKLDPAVQEKFAYKNAQRLISEQQNAVIS